MHDWLYNNVDLWSSAEDIVTVLSEAAAPEVGVDGAGLANCLSTERYRGRLESFMQDTQQRGVQSTPTFLIGSRSIVGAYPFETFQQTIEEALQK
jgi:predicted DsbA family dithiol-disulfide isomerase